MKRSRLLVLLAAVLMIFCAMPAIAEEAIDFTTIKDVWELISPDKIDFKIGIMATSPSQSEERYRVALQLEEQYGKDKFVVDTYPAQAVSEQETTISKVMAMAADPEIKAIVFNQAEAGTLAAIKALNEVREDILTVACNPNEDWDEVATVADVILCCNLISHGEQIANMAIKIGAKNLVHYSFPRHMSLQINAARRETIKQICESNGINFFYVTDPDPQGDAGTAGAQQFILEDIPRQIKALGEDTVFFATNTAMQEPIIKSIMDGHAMFCSQADPSPFDAFPSALGIEIPADKVNSVEYMLNAIEEKVTAANMNGRVATWSSSLNRMYTQAGVMYALLYGKGYVKETKGDESLNALKACFLTLAGDGASVKYWTSTSGKTYDYVFSVLGSPYIF